MSYIQTKIKPGFLPTKPAPVSFPYDTIREFQSEAVNWFEDETAEPILVLQAPTGSGKTEAFTQMVGQSKRQSSLLIYPTNALLKQQGEILNKKPGINAAIIDGTTLTGTGIERRNQLIDIIESPKYNAILTNPDILQAILQGKYYDPSDKLIRSAFEYVDAVIYDEFHAYDEFESSGLLLQTKIFSERLQSKDRNPKIVLSSATPHEEYLKYIINGLDLDIKRVRGKEMTESTTAGGRFREKLDVTVKKSSIEDHYDEIAEELYEYINKVDNKKKPTTAVIFNSAKSSNRFQSFLSNNYPMVNEYTKKDNGYDTHADAKTSETNHLILNTTSKGEVGLDFDIERLYMDTPHTAPAFIQRIGRAGRHSPATATVYGLEVSPKAFESELTYREFVERIYKYLPKPQFNTHRIQNLLGMRAAQAIRERKEITNKEIYADFKDIQYYNKWDNFFDDTKVEENDRIFSAEEIMSQNTERVLDYIHDCQTEILTSLRGKSNTLTIQYPIGDASIQTQYSAITALAHYKIDSIDYENNKISLSEPRDDPDIEIEYKHFNDVKVPYSDYRWEPLPLQEIKTSIENSDIETITSLNKERIEEFFKHLQDAGKLCSKIRTPESKEIEIEELTG